MKSVLIDECPDISTDDVNQLSVSSGRADWGVVAHTGLQLWFDEFHRLRNDIH